METNENSAFEAAASASNVSVETKDEHERREAPKNRHGQTCEQTCGPMAASGYHTALCHSVERASAPVETKEEQERRAYREENAKRAEAIRLAGLRVRQILADTLNAGAPEHLKATHKVIVDPKWNGSYYDAGMRFERSSDPVGMSGGRGGGSGQGPSFYFYGRRTARYSLRKDGTFNPEVVRTFWARIENDIKQREWRASASVIRAESQVLVDKAHTELKAIGFTYVPVSPSESDPTKVILRLDGNKHVTPEVAIEALATLKRLGLV